MIQSFVYVGREALEMMFLLFLVTTTLSLNKNIFIAIVLGLISGAVGGYLLGELLEDYEVLMYALLAALMFYLFFTSNNLPKHIKGHVDAIATSSTTALAGMFTIWFIFFRESMEIFTFMMQSANSTLHSWLGAIAAVVVVFSLFGVLKRFQHTKALFSITRYAFLVFGVWFAYEALEHAHIL